jgi:hypothetical protein
MNERSIIVKLTDGPCAGTHATVRGFGHDCWQRLGRRDQVWCRYLKNLYRRGEYVWSGEALTEHELKAKLAADKQNTYGSSEAA